MSKVSNISELFNSVKEQAAKEAKAGTLRLSELKKVMKKKNAEIKAVNDQLFLVLEHDSVKGNAVAELQAKQHAETQILEIKEAYKEQTKEYELYNVETAEAVAIVAVDKATKLVAPVTRGFAAGIRQAKKSLIG